MAVLLITHNPGLVAGVAARVNVSVYAGRIATRSTDAALRAGSSLHPRLLAAVLRPVGAGVELAGIPGAVPHPARLPDGCKFHPRCPLARRRLAGATIRN